MLLTFSTLTRNVLYSGVSALNLVHLDQRAYVPGRVGITFFDPSVIVWTITPQHTAHYGQFERVSIVFEVFRVRAWATTGWTSSPSATAPDPATAWIKFRRKTCMLLRQ